MTKLNLKYDRSRVPIYVQVASVMRQRIESGFWAEGSKISTIEDLEAEFGVARVTIRQAVEILRAEKLLDSHRGRGTFVSGKPKQRHWLNLAGDLESIVNSIKNNVLKRVYIEENAAPPVLAEGEGELAEAYTFLRSVQYSNDEPFSVVNLYIDQHLFSRDRKRFTHTTALPKIMEMDDVSIVHAYMTVTIGVADPETAELLNIGLGEPTADCRLILIDKNDTAIYVANMHYHKSCFALRNDLLDTAKKPGKPVRVPAKRAK